MADPKDETGKEQPPRPGEVAGPKRPYATLDLRATEVSGADKPAGAGTAAKSPTASSAASAKSAAGTSQDKAQAGPPPRATEPAGGGLTSPRDKASYGALLTHAAAGAAGALIVLIASSLFGTEGEPASSSALATINKRLADAERALGARGSATDMAAKLNELTRSTAALGDAHSKLAGDIKALETRADAAGTPHNLADRVAKLEDKVAALPGAPVGDAGDTARAANAGRVERELTAIKTDAGQLGQRIDALKSDIDGQVKQMAKAGDVAPLASKITALEQELQGLARSEADRSANASRVVLSLELANLRRAMERGGGYAEELAAVKKLGGGMLNLAGLDRYALEGVPSQAELAKSFRTVANSMIDAESEPVEGGLLERLMSGARSIVRVRKAGHKAEDTSLEATISRMETTLKEGRLGDVLVQGKKLPPHAALAGEDWLKKVEARYVVDQALADIDEQMKASFGPERGVGKETR